MRREFIETDDIGDMCYAPEWAVVLIPVEGGFMAFESEFEWDAWCNEEH